MPLGIPPNFMEEFVVWQCVIFGTMQEMLWVNSLSLFCDLNSLYGLDETARQTSQLKVMKLTQQMKLNADLAHRQKNILCTFSSFFI
jgi:hypothetical protein